MTSTFIDSIVRGCEAAVKQGFVTAPSASEIALNDARVKHWHDAKGKHSRAMGRKVSLRSYEILTNDWAALERRLDSPFTKADNPKHSS